MLPIINIKGVSDTCTAQEDHSHPYLVSLLFIPSLYSPVFKIHWLSWITNLLCSHVDANGELHQCMKFVIIRFSITLMQNLCLYHNVLQAAFVVVD